MTAVSPTHQAALTYAQRGWRVVPIRPGAKAPSLDAWQNAATIDPHLVDEWWRRWPDHGVGIVTGPATGLFVLDVDIGDNKHGDDTLADLEHTYDPLPATVEVITGSGGRHLYYRYPHGLEVRNDAGRRLGPGLDIRGEGGQVVAPPTRHPNGTEYAWEASSHPDDTLVADAPQWLLDLLTAAPEQPPRAERQAYEGVPRPGDRFAAAVTWPELLARDGATFCGNRSDHRGAGSYELWTRPGKDQRDGASASLYYGGTDVLKVFTPNWPGLTEGATYTRFGYFVATRYNGDFARATAELSRQQSDIVLGEWARELQPALQSPDPIASEPADDLQSPEGPRLTPWLIDWTTLWQREAHTEDWFCEPLLANGRGHALYAGAKSGKSLLMLQATAAMATGQPFLAQPPGPPQHVLYVDYEMTEDDLIERLAAFGYGPDSDLSHLHYILLPSIAPLDTWQGGDLVVEAARDWQCSHVVIDTMGRAVAGDENDADTFRAFYRHTGLALKAAHIGYSRLDHAGKDLEKGQRGSSAKNDDVDVVWRLTRRDGNQLRLEATHRRMSWVPQNVEITVHELDDERRDHRLDNAGTWPPGTARAAGLLDQMAVPIDAGRPVCRDAIKGAGEKISDKVLMAAMKYRRQIAMKGVEMPARDSARSSPAETCATDPRAAAGDDVSHPVEAARAPDAQLAQPESGNCASERLSRGAQTQPSAEHPIDVDAILDDIFGDD